MSITSLRNQPSWDFGSVSSRHATVTSIDPFRGFTGATSIPVSPVGSVRSHAKAFDGSLIITEHGDAGGGSEMYELWRPPSARFDGEVRRTPSTVHLSRVLTALLSLVAIEPDAIQ